MLEEEGLVLNDIVNLSNGAAEQAMENRQLAPWLRAYSPQQYNESPTEGLDRR